MHTLVNLKRFRYVFVAYIVYASIKTLVNAPQIAAQHGVLLRGHLYALAGIEFLAALGLLVRRLAPLATVALLCVFILAAVIDVALGEIPAQLLLYAAVILLLHHCATAANGTVASTANVGR